MKVVAINGSPHKEGNTALALNVLRDELARFVYTKTKRKPMILPVIMNI